MIYKEIENENGVLLKSHVILDKAVDLSTNIITLKIGSWEEEEPISSIAYTQDFVVELPTPDYDYTSLEDDNLYTRLITAEWKFLSGKQVVSLADLKEAKRKKIDEWRGIDRYSTVEVLDHEWQADANSQSLLSDAINFAMAGINPPPPIWRTMDNIDVEVSLDDLKAIAGAMAQRTTLAYYKSFQLKALLEAATTASQVNAITWETPT